MKPSSYCSLDRKLQRRYARWSLPDNTAELIREFIESTGRVEFDGWGDAYYADPPVKDDDVSWLRMCNGVKTHQREVFQNFKIRWHTGVYADTYDSYDSGETIEAGDMSVMDEFLNEFLQ